jgi:hypothetical protein
MKGRGAGPVLSRAIRSGSEIELHLVHETPAPIFARFDGPHDGVLRSVKVLGCVLVLGRVAAPYMSAFQAKPKVNPAIANLQALLATLGVRLHVANFIQVRTFRH